MFFNKPYTKILIPALCVIILVLILVMSLGHIPGRNTDIRVQNNVLDLSTWEYNSLLNLTGEWEFYWQKFLIKSDFDGSQKPDALVYFPSAWTSYVINGQKLPGMGYATYRLHVTGARPDQAIAMRVYPFSTSYALYIDNELMASNGKISKHEKGFEPQIKLQLFSFAPNSDSFDIIIHVSNFIYARGGAWYTLYMGSMDTIDRMNRAVHNLAYFLYGCFFVMIAACSYLYLLRRDQSLLLIIMLCLLLMCRGSIYLGYSINEIIPDISFASIVRIDYITLYWLPCIYLLLTRQLFPEEVMKKAVVGFLIYTILITILSFISSIYVMTHFTYLAEAAIVAAGLYATQRVVVAIKHKRPEALLILAGIIATVGGAIHDILFHNNIGLLRSGVDDPVNNYYIDTIDIGIGLIFSTGDAGDVGTIKKSAAELKLQATYTDFDFELLWSYTAGEYPVPRQLIQAQEVPIAVSPGTGNNTVKIELDNYTLATGNKLVIKKSNTTIATPYAVDPISEIASTEDYTAGNDISGVDATTNKYIAVYEVNQLGNIAKFTLVTLTAQDIKTLSPPLTQPTNLTFSSAIDGADRNINIFFTPTTADGYLIVRNTVTAPAFVPVDGTGYTPGDQTGGHIVAVGTQTSFTDQAALPDTDYHYAIYAYNGSGASTAYLTTNPLRGRTILKSGNKVDNHIVSQAPNAASAGFPDAGVNITFSEGLAENTTINVEKVNNEPSNFMVQPNVRRVSPLYFNIAASPSNPGNYTLVLDFSMLGLSETQWNSFVIFKRTDSTAQWQNVVDLGATIVSRQTDGVWGKFTISGLDEFSQFAGGIAHTPAILTVTSEDNDGSGSLRAAINTANAGDIIQFDVSGNTINLTSLITINKDLIIRGNGGTVIDGGDVSRIFNIEDGVSVKIENVTIQNGNDSGNVVGGILNEGSLTLVNSLVAGNKATGVSGGYGGVGGILQEKSTVLVNGYEYPIKLVLINTTVAGNEGAATDGGVGGVAVFAGHVEIYNSIIYGNSGEDADAYFENAPLTSYHSLFGFAADDFAISAGSGNIFAQVPNFVGSGQHPYLISADSPAIDGGDNQFIHQDYDIRGMGFARIVDGNENQTAAVDIGAYEYAHPTSEPTGLFAGKYGKAQIFDMQRSPAYPEAGKEFRLSGFQNIFDATLGTSVDWGIEGDRYVQFKDEASQSSNKYQDAYTVSLNLYESDGTLVKTISNYGTLWGLESEGFFYEGHDHWGYFITNQQGYAYGGSLTYTPTKGLITEKEDILTYEATTIRRNSALFLQCNL